MNNKWLRTGLIFLLLLSLLMTGCETPPPVTEPSTTVSDIVTDTTAPAAELTTQHITEPVSEAPTEPEAAQTTEPIEETPAQQTTQPITEDPTEPVTEKPTQPATEALTEPATGKPTEEPTEPVTEKPTQKPTEPATEKPTQKPTEPATEKPTQKPTEPATEKPTQKPTEPATEKPTEPTTEAPTQPVTETPTEPVTEAPTAPATEPTGGFEVHFIDVGQADAALVICDGKTMLIDGGNAADSNLIFSYLKKLGITHLDYVIGTHAHEDHIGGIAGALQFATVDTVYCPVTSYSSKAFNNFVKAVSNRGSSITVPSAGESFYLGSASCKIIAVNTANDDPNNTSIVMRITYGSTSFMFTGDAEAVVEQTLINRGEALRSTVLKVGHHGSSSSTSYVWLRNVMPEYAVISVGADNTYGHPTEAVLSRLRDADVKTFRTDMQGDIICTSNGSTVSFTVSRNAGADTFGGIGDNSTQSPTEDQQEQTHYVLNTNSMKFHQEDCSAAANISSKNRKDHYGTREELLEMGYSPCGWCDP